MKLKISRGAIAFIIFLILLAAIFLGIRGCNIHKQNVEYERNNQVYNGFKFQRSAGLWWTEWVRGQDMYRIPFHFSPIESENVSVYGDLANFTLDNVSITFNPKDQGLQYVALGASELSISLAKVFSILPQSACTEPEVGVCPPKPVITCTTTNNSVILLQVANETAIRLENGCIILQGEGQELVRAVDKFLYLLYGII
jgi:hypothetical protein